MPATNQKHWRNNLLPGSGYYPGGLTASTILTKLSQTGKDTTFVPTFHRTLTTQPALGSIDEKVQNSLEINNKYQEASFMESVSEN
jgi:hypothetical protein